MKNEPDTWYVLADGTHADPADVSHDKDGVLKHKNGVPVALRESGVPLTSGVATKENKKTAEAGKEPEKDAANKARDLKADDANKNYKTRESKAG